jgi:hypothetical protein
VLLTVEAFIDASGSEARFQMPLPPGTATMVEGIPDALDNFPENVMVTMDEARFTIVWQEGAYYVWISMLVSPDSHSLDGLAELAQWVREQVMQK